MAPRGFDPPFLPPYFSTKLSLNLTPPLNFTWLVTKQHFISLESLTKLYDGLDAYNENVKAHFIKQLLIIPTQSCTVIFIIFEIFHSKTEELNIFFFNSSFDDGSNFHWQYVDFIISRNYTYGTVPLVFYPSIFNVTYNLWLF